MSFELEKNGPTIIYRPVDSLLITVTFLKKAGRIFYYEVISFCFIPAGIKKTKKKRKKRNSNRTSEMNYEL